MKQKKNYFKFFLLEILIMALFMVGTVAIEEGEMPKTAAMLAFVAVIMLLIVIFRLFSLFIRGGRISIHNLLISVLYKL